MTAGKPSSTDSMLPRDGESVGRCGGCLGRAGALWAGPGALPAYGHEKGNQKLCHRRIKREHEGKGDQVIREDPAQHESEGKGNIW